MCPLYVPLSSLTLKHREEVVCATALFIDISPWKGMEKRESDKENNKEIGN